MKLYSLSYLASILFLLFCFSLQLISALQPVLLPTPTTALATATATNVELVSKTPFVDLERRGDTPESPQKDSANDKTKHDPDGRPPFPPPPPLPSSTTDKADITITEINITFTTIVYASSYLTIHNATNTEAAHQQQQQQPLAQSTASASDPNGGSLKSKLEEDQAALRRMIMILSLVGGLGIIAIVATVIIFTRMRAKNRKQREIEQQGNEGSTYELSGGMAQHSEETVSPPLSTQNIYLPSHNDDDNDNDDDDNNPNQHFAEPSAPPALTMISTTDGSSSSVNTERRRRHIISMLSQATAPSPSAPTAKELDAMVDDDTLQQPTSSSYHHHLHSHSHSYSHTHSHSHLPYSSSVSHPVCDHCSPLMTPEPPPPAYTPSAPPHYALPVEPVITDRVFINNESNSNFVSPLRRHSLGN